MICVISNGALNMFQSTWALSHKSPEPVKEDLVKIDMRNNNMSILVITLLKV